MENKIDDDSIAFSNDGDEDNVTSDYDEEVESEDVKLAKKVEKITLKTKASPMRGFQRYTPNRTPINKKILVPETPPRSLSGSVDYLSSQGSTSNFEELTAVYGISEHQTLFVQNGTKSNPYITFVDTNFPERNGGMFGFEVSFVNDIQYQNYKRKGYKIRASNIIPMDFEHYNMTIPPYNYFPQFAGRCTLLKGPSRVFWHRENKIFQEVLETELDSATKNAFKRDTVSIRREEICHHSYHLFVFPVDTVLDNNIFSGASKHVKVERFPMALAHNHKMNKFTKQMNSMCLI